MTTATEAPIETKAASPSAIASAPPVSSLTQPAGVVAATVPAAAIAPAVEAKAVAPAATAETVKVEAVKTDGSTWNLEAPKDATVAPETVKALETFAKEHGLTQVQAEKFLAREIAGRLAQETASKAEADTIGKTWLEEAKAHPDIGGAKFEGAQADAKRALMAYATPAEREIIANSPFANNPMFLAIMSRAAKGVPVEGQVYGGTTTAAPIRDDPGSTLYPMYAKK